MNILCKKVEGGHHVSSHAELIAENIVCPNTHRSSFGWLLIKSQVASFFFFFLSSFGWLLIKSRVASFFFVETNKGREICFYECFKKMGRKQKFFKKKIARPNVHNNKQQMT
jgi:hypothetical protein